MKNKIIPLLQEYFYDDWEKIQIVLGDYEKQKWNGNIIKDEDRFIIKEKNESKDVLGFDYNDVEEEGKCFIREKFSIDAYKKIYGDDKSIEEDAENNEGSNG